MKNCIYLIASLVIFSFLINSCAKDYHRNEGMIWHTSYHVTYLADKEMGDSIIATLNRVGASVNAFDSTSVVGRLNRLDSGPVDSDFVKVYEMSARINRMSAGMFDPTLGPLITAWGFGKGHRATSDTLRIDSLLQLVGISKTQIRDNKLLKADPRIEFNFSAIAKGYGCDCVAEMFERNGITDYLVEIGGEIRCSGRGPSGDKWRISIDRPIQTDSIDHTSECYITVSGVGIATSGNYRNFHKSAGGSYGHTISPVTGRPVATDILSATVIAPTAMEADGFATAFMAMGSKRSLELADSLKLPVMFVLTDMTVRQNKLFGGLVSAPRVGKE